MKLDCVERHASGDMALNLVSLYEMLTSYMFEYRNTRSGSIDFA